ncbi:MAG: DUF3551 domain-containing protein [Xanthobacteraceae bacterium]
MKALIFTLGIVVGACAICESAAAQNYPWCAYYGGHEGSGTNCGFTSYEQCMQTLSGMGGFCARNTQYIPPPGPHPAPAVRHGDPR